MNGRKRRPVDVIARDLGALRAICGEAIFASPAADQYGPTLLADHASITIAPSLAWAKAAAHRGRPPRGAHIGVFHPGPPSNRLDLRRDRATFSQAFGSTAQVLDEPTAETVLTSLRSDTAVGHFSCHGRYEIDQPLDSYLALATPLKLRNVLTSGAAPWLVNLSACETGIPDLQAAEQLLSFPTAFLTAGSGHVLATLWPVGDADASAFNAEVYRHMTAGAAHPAEATRRASQSLRVRSSDPKVGQAADAMLPDEHGFWWAPFVHYGSPW